MQLANRIGNIEQSNEQVDFDQIERDIGQEIGEEAAVDVNPSPAQQAAQNKGIPNAPPPTIPHFLASLARGKVFSKFTAMQPPQAQARPVGLLGHLKAAMAAIAEPKRPPQAPLESKFDPRLNRQPANDAKKNPQVTPTPVDQDQPRASRSRFARTVDTLMSLGALPAQLLVEIGRFRHQKESRFGSAQRLEKGLAQGDDEALRIAQANPALVKKKDLQPPAPTGPAL